MTFDDSPLDESDDQQLHHRNGVNDFENNDEHWLWTRVDRMKRSIENVMGNSDQHLGNRVKRQLFSWFNEPEAPKSEDSPPESPKPNLNFWDPFGLNSKKDEPSTTKAPEIEHLDEPAADGEDEGENYTEDSEDLYNVATDGSGSNKVDDNNDEYPKFYRFCKSSFHFNINKNIYSN